VFPIHCSFQLFHPRTHSLISLSSEGNGIREISAISEVGESVTEMPREYIFQYDNTEINVIDTPGLMDTKDETGSHDTDKKHVKNILRLLSTYDEIHGICISLNGNTNRLSNAFKYTLTEILRHLDTGACNNIIFILTHITQAKAHTTLAILKRFLDEKDLPIPLPPDKPTVYCFDNDILRYLAMHKNSIPQTGDDEVDAQRNWDKSIPSIEALLLYVFSLNPLSVANIKSIYNAEHTIRVLSKLVLETLMCICKDEDDLQEKVNEAQEAETQVSTKPADFSRHNLKTRLVITERKVVHTALDHTIVVCESPKCAKIVNGERVYPQICCKRCESWLMYWCSSMNYVGNCKVCGCGKSKHDWRNTETKIVTATVSQPGVADIPAIADSDSALIGIRRTISLCRNRIRRCKDETEEMLRTCIRLNTFVRQKALIIPDDELVRSLQNEIETYEEAGENEARQLKYLRQIQITSIRSRF